ncbi:MAG: hypothetical protein EOM56_04655 [Deltaproteobacteria bacterium]|nr:hypothetical protein [Deltaproteobacteria bacterium]
MAAETKMNLAEAIIRINNSIAEYTIRFCGLLILMYRSDSQYLAHHFAPYQGSLFNGKQPSRFAKKFATITNKTDWFITLNFDTKVWKKIDEDTCERAYDIFQAYTNLVMTNFPGAWFAWGAEIAFSNSGLHFHMFGSFGQELSRDQKRVLKRTWLEMTGSTNKSAFKAVEADNSVRGYLFSQEKKARKKQFRKMFPGRHMFGIVGKRNITFAKASKEYPISHEMKLLIEQLIRVMEYHRKGLDTKDYDDYVKREFYHFSFYPQEVVDAVKKLMKQHRH